MKEKMEDLEMIGKHTIATLSVCSFYFKRTQTYQAFQHFWIFFFSRNISCASTQNLLC